MHKYALMLMGLTAVTSAQTTTTSLFLVGFDQQSILGSIVGSDSTATTYALNCGSQDDSDCGVPPSFTFTQGPSTVHYAYTVDGVETINLGCDITSADHGVCSQTVNGVIGTSSTSTTSSTSFSNGGSELGGMIVTITAGAVASSANTVSQTSATSTPTSAGSKTLEVVTTSSSRAAGAVITKAPWLVGGAAAAWGYAAM